MPPDAAPQKKPPHWTRLSKFVCVIRIQRWAKWYNA
jgi:hypothetical protein